MQLHSQRLLSPVASKKFPSQALQGFRKAEGVGGRALKHNAKSSRAADGIKAESKGHSNRKLTAESDSAINNENQPQPTAESRKARNKKQ